MRRLAIAAVLLTSCTLATAQEIPSRSDSPPPKKSPAPDKKAEQSSPAKLLAREEQAFHRRKEVILKLREIGLRTGDEALLLQAEALEDFAWKLYLQKTATPGDKQ